MIFGARETSTMASAASLVEKATSDLLIGPDWGKNLELCDMVNSDPGQAKELVKVIKKRLANKSSTVQMLTLTVLETLMKNCGASVHQQVAERDVLHEMVKLVKKKADMSVRDKTLVLLDSWQEAFGGARGRFPQYFAAYNELRQSGVEFPRRAPEELVPIFTPPQTHPITQPPPPPPPQAAFAPGFHAPPPAEAFSQTMSLSEVENARGGLEVLTEMLNAVDPRNKAALKEELIVELVEQCRTVQKQVMNLVSTTSDETLLFQALSLNDDLQKTLAKHDAMASGASGASEKPLVPANFLHEEEESEEDSAQLARRPANRTRLQSAQKPIAAVPILPPPHQPAKVSPPATTRQGTSVDLLSGDMYSGTIKQSAISSPAPAPPSAPAVRPPSSPPVVRTPSSPPVLPPSSPPEDEDPDLVNPFALQYLRNGTEGVKTYNTGTTTSWSSSSSSSNQAPPYGTAEAAHPSFLPPPPIKHSQRQQFFQQKHHSTDEDLAARAQQSLSVDDEHMVNPYAAIYQQQQQQQQHLEEQQQQQQQQIQQQKSSFSSRAAGGAAAGGAAPPDNLFGDLVDFARMKARP